MAMKIKRHGLIIIWGVTAFAIVATAWFGKGTQYENAFFYVLIVGCILAAFWELISKNKG